MHCGLVIIWTTFSHMENTLKVLDETISQCDFVATCHYVEAETNKAQRLRFGVPSLVINIVVGSVVLTRPNADTVNLGISSIEPVGLWLA